MGYGRYVGRVGTLAVALGVGFAIASSPGLAWAEDGSTTGASGGGGDTSSVDTNSAITEAGAEPQKQADSGGGDPDDPGGAGSGPTTTTTTTGSSSTTVIGGGSPQVTISASTVTSSGNSSQQTAESNTATATATPTADVEPTGAPEIASYTPPEPEPTPTPTAAPTPTGEPAPLSSSVPEPDPLPSTAPDGSELLENSGDNDRQPAGTRKGELNDTAGLNTFDGAASGAEEFGLRMSAPNAANEVEENQTLSAANFSTGLTVLDAPAAAPAPDPIEAILVMTGSIISQVIEAVTAALAPIFGPGAPLYNSVVWGAIEAVRRQTNQAWNNSTPVLDLQTTGQQDADDREIHGTLGGSDPDGDALTYSVPTTGAGAPTNGTVTIDATAGKWTYKPNTGYVGTDSFTVTASDAVAGWHIHGLGQSHTGSDTITVTVTPPVTPNRAPVANDDGVTVAEGGTLNAIAVLGNDTDPDGNATIKASTVKVVDGPYYGSATVNADGTIKYISNGDEVPSDSFTYTVEDTSGAVSNPATVTVTISAVNDGGPVAVDDDGGSLREDTVGTVLAALLAINDVDPDEDKLTVTEVGNAQGGTVKLVDGTITFTPTLNYTGPASFDYTVTDGQLSNVGTVSFSITPVNDAPVAGDDIKSTNENTPLDGTIAATDVDTAILTYTVPAKGQPGGPIHGTVSINTATGAYTYTPDANYNGPDSFSATVSDGSLSDTATITITVDSVNAAPYGFAIANLQADDYGNVIITLLTRDAEGDPVIVTPPEPISGTLTLVSTSAPDFGEVKHVYRYTPDGTARLAAYDAASQGAPPMTESLTFKVSDATHPPASIPTVTVTVSPSLAAITDHLSIGTPGYIGTIAINTNPKNGHLYATVWRSTAFDEEGNPTEQTVSVVDVSDNNRIVGDAYTLNNPNPSIGFSNAIADLNLLVDTVIDEDGNVYVSRPPILADGPGSVVRINAHGSINEIVLDGRPTALAVDPGGKTVYAKVIYLDDETARKWVISVVDLAQPDTPIGGLYTMPWDGFSSELTDLAVDSEGRVYSIDKPVEIFVYDEEGNETSWTYVTDVIRHNTDGSLTRISMDGLVTTVAASPDGSHIYIEKFDNDSEAYYLVDLTTGDDVELRNSDDIDWLADADFGGDIAVSPDGQRVVVSHVFGFSVIDTVNDTVIASSGTPSGAVIRPVFRDDGQQVYLQHITLSPEAWDTISVISFANYSQSPVTDA
ncbi:Ig-like domain-containing protein [Mycolicibacterium celeriflavum]|uniref:Ig-like domain-containing protein n=1 Tax=Mycolicibacterium celeriflavum TaxID=1249101 RepID=UPI003CF365C3